MSRGEGKTMEERRERKEERTGERARVDAAAGSG